MANNARVFAKAIDQATQEMQRRSKDVRYKDDPVLWMEEVLGKTLWSKQKEIAYSVRDNQRTAVRSANNCGKTAVAGAIAAWFIATNDPHDTIVVCTAPAFAQLKTNLFHEFGINIRAAKQNDHPLPGYISVGQNIAEWKLADGTQLALGRRPPDKDAITTLQGIHRANVLVIIDEAGGIPPDLFVAAERITTTGNTRILAIGNPDRLGSEFHKMFDAESDWNQIHISGYDTPNFTNEDFPDDLRKYMLQPEWVARQRRVWGEDDARFKVSVLGEFPDADDTVFFPRSIIDRAIDTEFEEDAEVPTRLGVDLARFGDDSSVIYSYQGGRLRFVKEWSKTNAVESANIVHTTAQEMGAGVLNIDAGGLGGPIIDNLMTMGGHYTIVAMNGSASPPDTRRWLNARAFWYDTLREQMATNELDLDPEDAELLEDMGDINFEFTDKGSMKIESKKDLKSRTGKSPDHLDAAVYATFDESQTPVVQTGKIYKEAEEVVGGMPDYLSLIESIW